MPRRIRHRQGITYNRRLLGYHRVEFTRHALDRMKQRGITRDEVYSTIEKPDITGLRADFGRHRVRRMNTPEDATDVVYELLVDRVRVITTYHVDLTSPSGPPPRVLRKKPSSKSKGKSKRRGRPK